MSPVYKYTVPIGSGYEDEDNAEQNIIARNRKEADQIFSEMWPDVTPSTVIEPKIKKKSAPKK